MKKAIGLLLSLALCLSLSLTVFAEDYFVKAATLNVRSGNSTQHPVTGKLKYGDIVDVASIEGDWAKVNLGEKQGFVHTRYIASVGGQAAPEVETEAAVASLSLANADEIISYSEQYLGYRYTYGGSTPKRGFDCGGFIKYVYNHFGAKLSMGATTQFRSLSTSVKKDELVKGDLVYFSRPGKKSIAHTGIYIDGGKFIHASSPGDVVKIDTLTSGYYDKYYYGAKRILA